jgi:CheY-like chemotaxis protein
MAMKIVVLEDNAERCRVMRGCLADRFGQYELKFFDRPQAAISYLAEHLPDVLLISLDHDFELLPDSEGGFVDPGTGREVADFLAGCLPVCPVVIHSSNGPAALGMQTTLEDAGWTTRTVAPYDDLEWIQEAWFPTVRRTIVDAVQPIDAPQTQSR